MSILPALRAAVIIRALRKGGFKIIRQTGSHVRLRHVKETTRLVTVPLHSKDISRALLSSVLKQARLSVEEFLRLLRK